MRRNRSLSPRSARAVGSIALLATLTILAMLPPAAARAEFILTWDGPGVVSVDTPFSVNLGIGSTGDFLYAYQVTFTITRIDSQPTGGALRFTGAVEPSNYVLSGNSMGFSVVTGPPLPPTTLRLSDGTASGFNTDQPVPLTGAGLVRLNLAPNLTVFAGEEYLIAVDLSPTATFFLMDFASPIDPPDPQPIPFRVTNPEGARVRIAAVPEPSSLALLAVSGGILSWRRVRAHRRDAFAAGA